MFKLASLFVEIKAQDQALNTQLDGVRTRLGVMGTAIGTAVGNLAASAISSAASALTGFISKGIAGAANLGESISKVDAVFGESSKIIKDTADELAKSFGLSRQSILDAGAGIGLVGKAAGQSADKAAEMGSQMAKLAADASSFYNVPLDVALEKIRSGLVGESEPLRAFGVLLSEEAVAAEAVALGLAKSAREVDQQAKVMARASLITKGLGDATGDLARTSDSTANQWRKFQGTIENLAVEMGEALLPAINSLIGGANDMLQTMRPAFDSLKEGFTSFASGVSEAVNTIGILWRNLGDSWEIVTIKAREMGTNLIEIFKVIPTNLNIIGEYIANNWRQLITDGINAIGTVFVNLSDNIARFAAAVVEFLTNPTKGFEFNWKPLLDGFKATADKLPELARPALVSLQNEIDEVAGRIGAREAKRAEEIANKVKDVGKKASDAASKKTKDFKSEVMDVSEFASKLRSSIYEQGGDIPGQQLATQKRIAKNGEDLLDQMKRGVMAYMG